MPTTELRQLLRSKTTIPRLRHRVHRQLKQNDSGSCVVLITESGEHLGRLPTQISRLAVCDKSMKQHDSVAADIWEMFVKETNDPHLGAWADVVETEKGVQTAAHCFVAG